MKVVNENARVHARDCDYRASASAPAPRVSRFKISGKNRTHVMVVSAHSEHTEQIHPQSEGANEQQLVCIHFRRIEAGARKSYHLGRRAECRISRTFVEWPQTR